jgi:hypothetical protein
VAETVTSLELFAFVLLPIGVACSAWAIVLLAERGGAAKPSRSRKAASPDCPENP